MNPEELIPIMTRGFGNILAYIGVVIVLGSVLGEMLEKSGGAQVIAMSILRTIGSKNPQLAMSSLGAIVGIPVFCDTGFIILSRLNESITKAKRISSKKLSLGLAAGLYTTHTLVPPTPGPIAASGNLGVSDYLGLVMFLGFIISFPVVLGSYFFIKRITRGFNFEEYESQSTSFDDDEAQLSVWRAYLPILLPIVLIAIGTTSKLIGTEGGASSLFEVLGDPMIALTVSVVAGFFILRIKDLSVYKDLLGKGVQSAGPILIITGAGGMFGAVLKASSLADSLNGLIEGFHGSVLVLILISFLLGAILKTAQGSSTSAIVITSSMLAPLLPVVGIGQPMELALLVMAIGGGAMTVSHANDSFFWVVNQFGGLSVKESYRTYTLVTLIQGLITLLMILLIVVVSNLI